MKRTLFLALATLLFAFTASAWAQDSLGDYARKQRDQQKAASPNSKVWTNDDIGSSSSSSSAAPASSSASSDSKSASGDKKDDKAATSAADMDPAERAKQEADWKKKIADQKAKIAGLEHEGEIAEREYKLRSISWYTTTSKSLLNQKEWSDQEKKYQDDKADREKRLADAKADLDKMREDIRKAGFSSSLGE
jgi:hypothetical protein